MQLLGCCEGLLQHCEVVVRVFCCENKEGKHATTQNVVYSKVLVPGLQCGLGEPSLAPVLR